MRHNRSQSSLELAISVVGAFLLMYAAFNLLIWVNARLVKRHMEYEKTRKTASESSAEVLVDEADFPHLHILGEKD